MWFGCRPWFLAVYAGLLFLTYLGFKTVPTGFIPEQDQGYLIVALQLPDASSIDRTDAVLARMSEIAGKTPGVEATFAVTGLNLLTGTTQTNVAVIFLPLKGFDERKGKPAANCACDRGLSDGEIQPHPGSVFARASAAAGARHRASGRFQDAGGRSLGAWPRRNSFRRPRKR